MLLSVLFSIAHAISPNTTDPVAILRATQPALIGKRRSAQLSVTTERAGTDPQIIRAQLSSMDLVHESRTLVRIEEPEEHRNTALLFALSNDGQSSKTWLYLNSLQEPTELNGVNQSASFMGTDFLYSDLVPSPIDEWTFSLLSPSTPYNDEPCWLIEGRPKPGTSNYSKTHIWISQQKEAIVQTKAWIPSSRQIKTLSFDDWTHFGGHWYAKRIHAQTRGKSGVISTSTLVLGALKLNAPNINAADFSLENLGLNR